jgi:tetratricopeptide (TPR) repeat protein
MLTLLVQISIGQNVSKSDAEIVKLADKSFQKGDYKEAGTLYAQLVSVNPNEALYNYRYGVCALKTDRKNALRPIKYLKFAADNLVEKEDVYYYLGLAYHNNMKFTEAIEAFLNYTSVIVNPTNLSEDAEQRIINCENGLKLNKVNLISSYISNNEMDSRGFYKAYKMGNLGCNLILKPDQLKSESIPDFEVDLAFITAEKDYVYYSDKDLNGSMDIYRSTILSSGGFGPKEKLIGMVNTIMDEAYPVVLDQGKTMYFCSKGHNSMGGYDIFKSVLNEANGEWGEPENLDFEINSPFDDILFLEDKNTQTAWFSSNRKSVAEKLFVYNVKLNSVSQNVIEPAENLNNVPLPSTGKAERENKMNDRLRAGALADSAYFIVGLMEKQIRSLTNSRDRANRLTKSKKDDAIALSDELFANCRSLLNVSDEEALLKGIASAKEKDFNYQTADKQSAKAGAISTILGQQINIKRSELAIVKKDASGILSTSTTKTLDETEQMYNGFIQKYNEADTLISFSDELNLISQNQMTFELSESDVFTNLNGYLQNQLKIENIKKTASSDELQSFETHGKEAKVLMEMAINNRSKAVKEASVLQQGYYLKDAQTFEETAINQQLEILKLAGQTVVSNYKAPTTTKSSPKPKVVDPAKKTSPETPVRNSVSKINNGIVYKVQLGAFGSEPSADKLKGIDPVSTEEIPGKSIVRYFGGQFTDKTLADKACLRYKQNGFADAFVVAFNNGKKISMAEAQKMLNVNSDEVKQELEKKPTPEQKEVSTPVVISNPSAKKLVVELKVQLAALKDQKPTSWKEEHGRKIGSNVDEIHLATGVYVYASGSFTNYAEASEFLKSVKEKGYKDAFLIGVKEGIKIPVSEALELLK